MLQPGSEFERPNLSDVQVPMLEHYPFDWFNRDPITRYIRRFGRKYF